jgi:hypothetical protein
MSYVYQELPAPPQPKELDWTLPGLRGLSQLADARPVFAGRQPREQAS